MTTLYPAPSHHHHHHAPPLDQPTPQSPSPLYMSANHAGSTTTTSEKQHQSVAPGFSSPPSYPRQQHSITTNTNTFPTPASSAAGTVPPTTSHEDEDTVMMDDYINGIDEENGPPHNYKRRRTDSSHDRGAPTIAPALRHRNGADEHTSPTIPTIQELLNQPDVRPYYLVCPKPHQPSYPDMTENLLSLYGLKPLADKVARFHPVTGVKNKLRKSYKGFINDLPGKNVVEPRSSQTEPTDGEEPAAPNMSKNLLTCLWRMPEEEWRNREVHGKELDKPLDLSKLRKALTLTKGDIPDFDGSSLGLDDERRRKTPHPTTPAIGTPHINGSTPGGVSSVPVGGDDAKLKKKKRKRPEDGNHEVYAETEGDDNSVANSSVSVSGGPGGGVAGPSWDAEKKKKKRKKNPDINSPGTGGGGMNIPHHVHGSGISVQGGGGLYGR